MKDVSVIEALLSSPNISRKAATLRAVSEMPPFPDEQHILRINLQNNFEISSMTKKSKEALIRKTRTCQKNWNFVIELNMTNHGQGRGIDGGPVTRDLSLGNTIWPRLQLRLQNE